MKTLIVTFLLFLLPTPLRADMAPINFTDSAGNQITITAPPKRVVSLVPSITEMLVRIDAGQALAGITHHSLLPPGQPETAIVGGFFSPDPERLAALGPDLIFYSSLHRDMVQQFGGQAILVNLSPGSIAESYSQIRLLGRIFQRIAEAAAVVAEEERQLAIIADKVKEIPLEQRLRIIRFMGRDKVMVPGDDSFQIDFIRAAGGITPQFGRKGSVIELSLEEWQEFNPQVIYSCSDDREALTLLEQPGWNEVEAIQNRRMLTFPCQLTCRASTHSGSFVSWLAASTYGSQFSDRTKNVLPEQIVNRQNLAVELDYLDKAEILESDIRDFRNKTLALSLKQPMNVLSTLEGWRSGITTVANHYFPPPSWGLGHEQGLDALRQHTQKILGFDPDTTSMLFTGANMANLAVVKKTFRDLTVYALVTAGVEGNAVRMSQDTGSFYEPDTLDKAGKPGTINVVLLSNAKLSARAMTRAMISATEAKSAALADLDIRSSYTGKTHQATGTGTDNILVVEGSGMPITNSGGHTKMGELIARAVYAGVHEAIANQNGLTVNRSLFKRLKERRISLWDIAKHASPEGRAQEVRQQLEKILLKPRFAAFLETSLAMSDHYEQGLIDDLSGFDLWCRAMTEKIAGQAVEAGQPLVQEEIPLVLRKSFSALLTGILATTGQSPSGSSDPGCEASNP